MFNINKSVKNPERFQSEIQDVNIYILYYFDLKFDILKFTNDQTNINILLIKAKLKKVITYFIRIIQSITLEIQTKVHNMNMSE